MMGPLKHSITLWPVRQMLEENILELCTMLHAKLANCSRNLGPTLSEANGLMGRIRNG